MKIGNVVKVKTNDLYFNAKYTVTITEILDRGIRGTYTHKISNEYIFDSKSINMNDGVGMFYFDGIKSIKVVS